MNSLSSFSATFRVSSSRQQQQLHLNLIARIPTMSIEELFFGWCDGTFPADPATYYWSVGTSSRHRIDDDDDEEEVDDHNEARYQLWLNKVKCWSLVFDRGQYFEWPWKSHIELMMMMMMMFLGTADCLWLAVDPRNNASLRYSRLGNEYFPLSPSPLPLLLLTSLNTEPDW